MKKIITILMIAILILLSSKVKASGYEGKFLGSLCYRNGANSSTCNSMTLANDGYWTTNLSFGTTESTHNMIKYIEFPSQVSLSNEVKEISFQVKFMRQTADSESDITGSLNTTCYPHYIIETDNTDFEMYIQDMQCTTSGIRNQTVFESHFSLNVAYTYNQNDYSYSACYITGNAGDNFTVRCPVTTNNVSGLKISMNVSDIDSSQYRLGIYPVWTIEKERTQEVIDAITNQTQEVINSNTSYEGINQSEEINGSQELTSYEQEEQNLLDSLNMTEVDNLDITINPNASSFIWTIVDALRNMSSKIIVFMTSVLGLGVIKMLLNR